MLWGMAPLLVLAIISGGLFKAPYFEMVTQLLPAVEYHIHNHTVFWVMTIGTQLFVIAAIAFAWNKYKKPNVELIGDKAQIDPKVESGFIYQLLYNQYYIPQFYDKFLIQPYRELSMIFWKDIDMKIVDASVDGIANIFYKTGQTTHTMQNGNLSSMLRWMVIGLIALLSLAVVFGLAVQNADAIKALLSSIGAM